MVDKKKISAILIQVNSNAHSLATVPSSYKTAGATRTMQSLKPPKNSGRSPRGAAVVPAL